MMNYSMAGGEFLNYWVIQHQMPEDVNPGKKLAGYGPPYAWKQSFATARVPEPTVIALDRQVQITAVPIDSARAEEVHKEGGQLSARVYFAVDHIELQHPAAKDDNTTMVFGRLEKVEILTRNKAVLATFNAESFHLAPEVAAPPAGGGSTPSVAKPSATPKGNEADAQRVQRSNQEMFDKIRAQQEKKMACMGRAQRASKSSNPNDPVYKKTFDSCMAEK
jgi:hypothetical protein